MYKLRDSEGSFEMLINRYLNKNEHKFYEFFFTRTNQKQFDSQFH